MTRRAFLGALAGGSVCLGLDGTLPAGEVKARKPELRFGVVADAQYADADTKMGRHYRLSADKLAECVKELNGAALDFTIHLGDLIDRDFASFQTICPIYDRLTMPHYHVLGNHDFSVRAEDRPKVLGALGLDKLGTKKGCYDFTLGRWRFVVLDGTDVSTYAHAGGSEKHVEALACLADLKRRKAPNANGWNGGMGQRQIAWLTGTLEAAAKARQRVILFCHMPVYPTNAHNLFNDAQLLKVIDGCGGVAAWINGHNHAGNYGSRNGVHYLTIRGMVDTLTTSFAIVEVHADCLKVIGRGREPGRTMKT